MPLQWQGHYAYVGVGPRLVILDVSDPSHPILVGQTAAFPGVVEGVAVVGNTAYVAAGTAGLRVINVANPAAPVEVGVLRHTGGCRGRGRGGKLRLCRRSVAGGLRVVNVVNPAAPAEVGFYDTPREMPRAWPWREATPTSPMAMGCG